MKGVTYKIIGGDGREYGPATLDEVREWAADGRVGPATLVWESGDAQWLPASGRPELRWDLPVVEAPPVMQAPQDDLAPAPFAPRVAAYLFDAVSVSIVVWLVSLPWNAQFMELQKAAEATIRLPTPDIAVLLRFYALFLGFHIPVSLAYHVGFNTLFAATPGKMMVGLRVVAADGSRLTFARALGRFVAEALSVCSFGVGYLISFANPERQALHDLLARTRVVRNARARVVA